jgi:hypothetical protein
MTNMKVEEFKFTIHEIKFWVSIFKKDVWTWIHVVSYVVNFTKDKVKDL